MKIPSPSSAWDIVNILGAKKYPVGTDFFFFPKLEKHSRLDKHPRASEHSRSSSTNGQGGALLMSPNRAPRRAVTGLGRVESGQAPQPRCFIYAADVPSMCPGNGKEAMGTMWAQ